MEAAALGDEEAVNNMAKLFNQRAFPGEWVVVAVVVVVVVIVVLAAVVVVVVVVAIVGSRECTSRRNELCRLN